MVYKHFSCAPEPSMLPGASYMIPTNTAILSLCHANPWFYLQLSWWYALPPSIIYQISQSVLPVHEQRYISSIGTVDSVRSQHTLCLKDSSTVTNPSILAEAPILKPGTDILASCVSSKVSYRYWKDGEKRYLWSVAFFPVP